MRISDWSSDVCSSDLRDRKRRCGGSRSGPRTASRPSRRRSARRRGYARPRPSPAFRPPRANHGGRAIRWDRGGTPDRRPTPRSRPKYRGGARRDREGEGNADGDLFSPPWKGGVGGGSILAKVRSEEHTSELQSLMRISYAVFCLKKKKE